MPQENVTFTVPDNGQGLNNGAKVNATFTYGTAQNADGSHTVTGASGTYQTLDATGNVVNTYQITGIQAPNGQNASDNHLFIVADPTMKPIVNFNGISFTLNSTAPTGTNSPYVNFFDSSGTAQGTQAPTDTPTYHLNNTGNGNNATGVTEQAATCFCSGTHVLTSRGEVLIEDLRVGDVAVTASGAHRPVRWIGRGIVHPRRHPRPHEVQPVRIRAGALGEGRPARDLVVSPGHGIALDLMGEVIVTAGSLVNGSTVVQEDAERVAYWHVELDGHDFLLAEGQPAESYLDMGNRAFFARMRGGAAVVALAGAPDPATRTHADFCRPFHGDGPVLAFARERIGARARALGWHLSGAEPWAGVHLIADGVRVEPEVRGLAARFLAPAGAKDLWLVSPAASPGELGLSTDGRRLGLYVAELRVGEGWDARAVALDDPLLCAGFQPVEGEGGMLRRWTAGRARLPATLWAGADRTLVVHLEASSPALPRWTGPEAEAATAPEQAEAQPAPRLVHAA